MTVLFIMVNVDNYGRPIRGKRWKLGSSADYYIYDCVTLHNN